MKKWVCSVCGLVYEGSEPPAECPQCKVAFYKKVGQEAFYELKEGADKKPPVEDIKTPPHEGSAQEIKKWVCSVCGLVYEGVEPPAECPHCKIAFYKKVGPDKFYELKEDAAEETKAAAPIEIKSDGTVKKWVCSVCGLVYEGVEPPAECPQCKVAFYKKVGQEAFYELKEGAEASKAEAAAKTPAAKADGKVKKWICPVCGYVHEGPEPPAECPMCKVSGDKFVASAEGKMEWADQHVVGVAQGCDPEILQGLRDNFMGECTEVGMYLAMARVAHREGYPEIGLYWEKAAWEEAEHAAKFAELLGEVVTDSTKRNLEMRAEAENGACMGKKELATLAKQQGLDAIHDTVHEMAKDEARHGCAFEGLLKRYFG